MRVDINDTIIADQGRQLRRARQTLQRILQFADDATLTTEKAVEKIAALCRERLEDLEK